MSRRADDRLRAVDGLASHAVRIGDGTPPDAVDRGSSADARVIRGDREAGGRNDRDDRLRTETAAMDGGPIPVDVVRRVDGGGALAEGPRLVGEAAEVPGVPGYVVRFLVVVT